MCLFVCLSACLCESACALFPTPRPHGLNPTFVDGHTNDHVFFHAYDLFTIMLIAMCLSPDVIGCCIGKPRIQEDKIRAGSTFAAACLGFAACHLGLQMLSLLLD